MNYDIWIMISVYILLFAFACYVITTNYINNSVLIRSRLDFIEILYIIFIVVILFALIKIHYIDYIVLLIILILLGIDIIKRGITQKGIKRLVFSRYLIQWKYIKYAEVYMDKKLKIEYFDEKDVLQSHQYYNKNKYDRIIEILESHNIIVIKK